MVTSKLQLQLSDEQSKPINDHKSFTDSREAIELLVRMIKMAYRLPYTHDDHKTAINVIEAQLEKIHWQTNFAQEQDRLKVVRILHAECIQVEVGKCKTLDLELLLNQVW